VRGRGGWGGWKIGQLIHSLDVVNVDRTAGDTAGER